MIYVFFPFISAALYGLGYVLMDKLLKSVPIPAFMLVSSLIMSGFLVAFAFLKPGLVPLTFLSDKKVVLFFVATIVVNITAWVITLLALQNTSASYVSFAEISYPIFTLLFLFFIFDENQFTWQSFVGAGLIMAGSVVLVMSQLSKN